MLAAASLLVGAAMPLYAQAPQSSDGANVTAEPVPPPAPDMQPPAPAPAPVQEMPLKPNVVPPLPGPAVPQASDGGSILPQPVTKMQEMIDTKLGRFVSRKPEQEAVQAFYRAHDYKPMWSADGNALPKASAAIAHLQNVRSEGLEPRDYPTPDMNKTMSEDEAAAADLRLTAAVLTYARHASSGRVAFTRVSGSILYPNHALEPAKVLEQLAAANDVAPVLASFEPQQPGYKALKAELARLLTSPAPAAEEPEPRKGKHAKAEKPRSRDVVGTVIANMERWRWLPRDLGNAHVIVNIPDFTLAVFNGGAQVWQTRIVAGKPGEAATPLLSETMKYLTVNPTWNVPPSIIRNEYLPALERDPNALDRVGLKVGRNPDGSIRVYQPPGDENALGHIRFNFPNPFLVYQHDTPTKHLFARESRAYSHGCMRVQNPEKYAEVLLSISQPNENYSIARIKSMYGDDEKTIKLQKFIPVHITYQTAFVDKPGHLALRSDVYGLDTALLNLMRGSERAVADIPIPRSYTSSSKPVMARLPARPREDVSASSNTRTSDNSGWNGGWNNGWDNSSNGWGGSRWNEDAGSARAYAAPSYRRRSFDRGVGFW